MPVDCVQRNVSKFKFVFPTATLPSAERSVIDRGPMIVSVAACSAWLVVATKATAATAIEVLTSVFMALHQVRCSSFTRDDDEPPPAARPLPAQPTQSVRGRR